MQKVAEGFVPLTGSPTADVISAADLGSGSICGAVLVLSFIDMSGGDEIIVRGTTGVGVTPIEVLQREFIYGTTTDPDWLAALDNTVGWTSRVLPTDGDGITFTAEQTAGSSFNLFYTVYLVAATPTA